MHIWQMNLDGSNLRQITDGVGENWSNITADGKWLIYVSPAGNPEALWKKSLTGDENPVKLLTGGAGSNSISPNNKHFIVSYKTTGENGKLEYKFGLMPFEPTDAPQDIGFNPEIDFNNWKADSSGFYWIDRGVDVNNIWFYSIADKSKKQITNFNEMKILKCALSPDGNTLAVSRGATVSNIFKISEFDKTKGEK
jgi:Tol biopolymer transport system component